jgi:hypothetical protein
MILASLLLTQKLLTVTVEPENPSKKDDQTLATCAVAALTARPSELKIGTGKEPGDAKLTVGNHTGMRIHVLGKLVKADGMVLVEVNHVTHGFDHTLCHQLDGLLDEMVKTYNQKKKHP